MPRVVFPKDDAERVSIFWSLVDKSGDCWLWTGPTNDHGYGCTTLVRGTQSAHRASYLLAHGSIKEGAFVCHHCDNPPCVNPAHLYEGDSFTNARDMGARGRYNARAGDDHPSRFYNHPVYVRETLRCAAPIFAEARKRAGLTQRELANRADVDPLMISQIERGQRTPRDSLARAWCEICGVVFDDSSGLPILPPSMSMSAQLDRWLSI